MIKVCPPCQQDISTSAVSHQSLPMQASLNLDLSALSWPHFRVSKSKRYLMAQPPTLTPPQAEEAEPLRTIVEDLEPVPFDEDIDDSHISSTMSGAGSSSNTPHDSGCHQSSKYSHEDTRPEKIQENLKNLDDTMHKTLRRLDHLETKLKSNAGKRRKKHDPSSARRNEELEKALDKIMDGVEKEKSS